MESGAEWLDLFHQPVGQLLTCDDGQTRNVIDRLLGVELCALPARPVQNVHQVRLEIEQTQLEHGEKPDRACSDDGDVCLDGAGHALFHKV